MYHKISCMLSVSSVIAALTFFLMPAPTVLYDANLAPVVTLPAGYFVMQADEDAPAGYISVVYDDLVGYVRTGDVRAVDYRPVTKYEKTVQFRVDNDGQPINLRTSPRKNGKIINTLRDGESGRCYGYIDGDRLISGAGETWYYVAVGDVRGYCYGAHVSVDSTPPNIIEKEEDEPPSVPTETVPEDEPEAEIPPISVVILIVALCVPVPFVMLYLFRKPKSRSSDKN